MKDVESASAERWWAALRVPSDPTGTVPEFQVSSGARSDPDGSWSEGRWSSAWDSSTGRIEVESALLGAGQDLDVTEGEIVDLWVRWGPVDGETPVLLVERLRVL